MDVLRDRQVTAGYERLAESSERKGRGAADAGRERGDAHREQSVSGPGIRPLDRREAALGKGEPFDRDPSSEVLVRVLQGELPWCQHTHRADDIATAIRLSDEFGYRLVINHATEAFHVRIRGCFGNKIRRG